MTTAGQRCVHDPDGLNSGAWPVSPDEFITPTDSFFTRSHARIPDIDPESWKQRAREVANRALRPGEWEQFLPGRPYDPACR